jgi:hypothetical protein
MKVTITYHDNDSLTIEEVVRQATHNYGKNCRVEVSPESWIAYDAIHFGVQQLITHEQLSLLYDRGDNYQHEIKKLRTDVLYKIHEIVDQVIIENETKVS